MAYSDFSLSSVLKAFQLSYSENANLFANEQKLESRQNFRNFSIAVLNKMRFAQCPVWPMPTPSTSCYARKARYKCN